MSRPAPPPPAAERVTDTLGRSYLRPVADRAALLAALAAAKHPDGRPCPGNHRRSAEALGLNLRTFQRRLEAAGLTADELRELYPLSGRQPGPPPRRKRRAAGKKKST